MASRDLAPPRLPDPPTEVTVQYITDLVRALEVFIQQENNPGLMRGTRLTLTDLPTSEVGLEAGSLFRIGQEVKVSLLATSIPDGSSVTSAVGNVTVSIS